MATFQDSVLQRLPDRAANEPRPDVADNDKAIGEIIATNRGLSSMQVDKIAALQRRNGLRFGEAAIALGLASEDDVLFALSKQFEYPVATDQQQKLSPELVTLTNPFSRQSEVFRSIRSQLLVNVFNEQPGPRRALAIVSPGAGDGKTFFAANLAVALAQLGGRTLLVDADMRGPRMHSLFLVPNAAGLSGLLAGRADEWAVKQVPTLPGLFVLPVGIRPPNPLELFERRAFGLLVRALASSFDHVLFDTSAAQYGADASVVASRCGAALVVVRKNSSRISELAELSVALNRNAATTTSVVVNEF